MSTDVFAVIADPTRRRILRAVQGGPRPVNDVVTELQVSQPTVSKHLKVLREAGLVTMQAQGQRRLYSLETGPLREIEQWLASVTRAEETDVVVAPAEQASETSARSETSAVQEKVPATGSVTEVEPSPTAAEGLDDTANEPVPDVVESQETFAGVAVPPITGTSPITETQAPRKSAGAVAAVSGADAGWSEIPSTLDPLAQRPQSGGTRADVQEAKQSGFLATLFGRKRGR